MSIMEIASKYEHEAFLKADTWDEFALVRMSHGKKLKYWVHKWKSRKDASFKSWSNILLLLHFYALKCEASKMHFHKWAY